MTRAQSLCRAPEILRLLAMHSPNKSSCEVCFDLKWIALGWGSNRLRRVAESQPSEERYCHHAGGSAVNREASFKSISTFLNAPRANEASETNMKPNHISALVLLSWTLVITMPRNPAPESKTGFPTTQACEQAAAKWRANFETQVKEGTIRTDTDRPAPPPSTRNPVDQMRRGY
jgi:hypothetical protein